ncbi:MAG: hypothetical protein V1735_01200 [Nanoarchaeota archaeon]
MTTQREVQVMKVGDIGRGAASLSPTTLEQFIRLPWSVYAAAPLGENWVPPNLRENRFVLSAANPFFDHAKAALYLALRDGVPAGRIAAIIDDNHNNTHSEKTGFFGYYEAMDDPAVAQALFSIAESWLAGFGMETMRGPMNPSTNDECGFLMKGFDIPPEIMMPYTPEYYLGHAEANGLSLEKTLRSYLLTSETIAQNHGKLGRLAGMSRRQDLRVRPMRLDDLAGELAKIKEIYNDAWAPNWGFVPMTEPEVESMAERLVDLVDPNMMLFAERLRQGDSPEPIGFLLGVPNYNIALKHMDGKDGPLEKLKFLYYGGFPARMLHGLPRKLYSGRLKECRVMILGVKKGHQAGSATALMLHAFQENLRPGTSVDMGWTLDDNVSVNRPIERLGGVVYKLHGIYEKQIQ